MEKATVKGWLSERMEDPEFRRCYERESARESAAAGFPSQINAAFLKALVVAFGRASPVCAHDDPARYTIPAGNVIHCACGESFRVKCMHTKVERVLARVFRCVDCREWRGIGAA